MRIVLASLLLVGCIAPGPGSSDDSGDSGDGTGTGSSDGSGSGTGTGSGSGMTTPPPPPPVASGTYQVISDIDLTVEALLPQSVEEVVVTLRDFEMNPAGTLFDLAEDAGVPAVGTIRDALPQSLEDKLEGWINDEIATITLAGVPITQVAGGIVGLAETTLTHFAIESELTIGSSTATHTLTGLDFSPAGIDTQIAFDPTWNDVTSTTATYSATSTAAAFGDHGYAIAYGEYAWRALETAFVTTYGMGTYDALLTAVNCDGLAATIAQKCYAGYCVGHETELEQICVRGVEEVINRAYAKFAEQRFDLVHFASGSATLVDSDMDLDVETLASGVWDAEINAGQGLRHVPATFTATK
jgi:hypothetical protein